MEGDRDVRRDPTLLQLLPSRLFAPCFVFMYLLGDKVEEIAAEGRPQPADISMESIGHMNWVDDDPD